MCKHHYLTVVVNGPKFTDFLFNAGGIVADNAAYLLSISLSVSEIFVVKIKSCIKLRQILDVIAFSNFKGAVTLKAVPTLTLFPIDTSREEVS